MSRSEACKTIRQIVERWAPPSENDTRSYVLSVASACRRDPDERLHVDVDPLISLDLARAIARHECGAEAEAEGLGMTFGKRRPCK